MLWIPGASALDAAALTVSGLGHLVSSTPSLSTAKQQAQDNSFLQMKSWINSKRLS